MYIEPLTVEVVEQLILKEKPDSVLPTLGGQAALNLAMELDTHTHTHTHTGFHIVSTEGLLRMSSLGRGFCT